MPTFSFSSSGFPFTPFTKILSADVNTSFNDIKTFFNTTKLDSTNVQLGGLTADRLAAGTDGQVLTTITATPTWTSTTDSSRQLANLGLAASVAGNALTIALKTKAGTDPTTSDRVQVGFRSSTVTAGTYNIRTITGALSVTVSSGSTLGQVNAQPQYVWVYLIDNAGTPELAVSGSRLFDENSVQSTTAEGGAGAADSATVLYSTTARSNVPIRLIGRIKSTQATAGTWATTPSEVSTTDLQPVQERSSVWVYTFNGYGSTNTKIVRFASTVVNTGSAITYADSATLGASFTINEVGLYTATYWESFDTDGGFGISLNSSQLTTAISSITISDIAVIGRTVAIGKGTSVTVCLSLRPGDVLRPHTNGDGHSGSLQGFVITKVGN